MITLKKQYTKSDSALDQNFKNKENIIQLVLDINAETNYIREDVIADLIKYAQEQKIKDDKQDFQITLRATSEELIAESKARDNADKALTQELGDVKQLAESTEHKVVLLERKGSYRGTFSSLADAQIRWPNPNNGDYVLTSSTGSAPYQEYIFENGTWEQAGVVNSVAIDTSVLANKNLNNVSDADFLAKGIKALLASKDYVDSRTISFDVMEAGKTYLVKMNLDSTKTYWEFSPLLLENEIFTRVNDRIEIYKGEIKTFDVEQKAPSKFADNNLFRKIPLSFSGEFEDITDSYKTRKWTFDDAGKRIKISIGETTYGATLGADSVFAFALMTDNTVYDSGDGGDGFPIHKWCSNQSKGWLIDKITYLRLKNGKTIDSNKNGLAITKFEIEKVDYKYVALKDITHTEMGNAILTNINPAPEADKEEKDE